MSEIFDPVKSRPLDDWVLCRALPTDNRFAGSDLIMPKDMDKDVVTEGVAEVLAVGPGKMMKHGRGVMLIKPGTKVIYRGFLRFAHQLGDLFGADKASEIFFLKSDDILCEVEGPGRVGEYGEYVL
jgi:co-chaperonin GroES (HSP10)